MAGVARVGATTVATASWSSLRSALTMAIASSRAAASMVIPVIPPTFRCQPGGAPPSRHSSAAARTSRFRRGLGQHPEAAGGHHDLRLAVDLHCSPVLAGDSAEPIRAALLFADRSRHQWPVHRGAVPRPAVHCRGCRPQHAPPPPPRRPGCGCGRLVSASATASASLRHSSHGRHLDASARSIPMPRSDRVAVTARELSGPSS